VERTRQIDVVVPRNRARIRFGAIPEPHGMGRRHDWLGIAPLLEPREFVSSLRAGVSAAQRSIREKLDFGGGEASPEEKDQK
jgi:hypothetical protein